MNSTYIIICIALMALVTYIPRMLPLVIFRKKLNDGFLKSFLLYMPYGVLSAMIFPAIIYSTSSLISAVTGGITALVMAFFRRGLLTVAVSAAAAVFITERILSIL